MTSARELLEKADALMRRAKGRVEDDIPTLTDVVEAGVPGEPAGAARDEDVPTLTEVVAPSAAGLPEPAPPRVPAPEGGQTASGAGTEEEVSGQPGAAPRSTALDVWQPVPQALEDLIPQLAPAAPGGAPGEDVGCRVDEIVRVGLDEHLRTEPERTEPEIAARLESEIAARLESEIAARLESEIAVRLESEIAARLELEIAARLEAEADARAQAEVGERVRVALAAHADAEARHWTELREQLFASVIQRLDLFTEGALRGRLAEEIRPIVERAGAELVDRIGAELGAKIRSAVADAIDREIGVARASPPVER
jgi:hypothetical protein